MAHVYNPNVSVGGANQARAIWHLVVTMLRAGARMVASGDGTSKVVGSIQNAVHNAFPLVLSSFGTGGAITASENHPYGLLVTLSLPGASLVAASASSNGNEGDYIAFTNGSDINGKNCQIYEVLSSTTCKVLVEGIDPVANATGLDWELRQVTNTFQIALGSVIWWACLELMETYQLPLASAPGAFRSGEVVTQTGTGATGEIVGAVWDVSAQAGWMIIHPRTGTWNGTGTVTGQSSGATGTPSSLIKFRRQIVFTRGHATNHWTGSIWYQCLRADGAEAAELYSAKAANVNCTATVAPGASITAGNRQVDPTVTDGFYCIRAQDNRTWNGTNALVHADGFLYYSAVNTVGPNGLVQAVCANLMPRSDRCADGTWWIFQGNTNRAGGGGNLLGQFRIDDGEPGDPEVIQTYVSAGSGTSSRDVRYGEANGINFNGMSFYNTANGNIGPITSWPRLLRRSIGNYGGGFAISGNVLSTVAPPGFLATARAPNIPATGYSYSSTMRLISHPSNPPPLVRHALYVDHGFKGRFRWMFTTNLGTVYDTLDSKKFLCVGSASLGVGQPAYGAVYIGPWDSTSTPTQT